MQEQKVLKNQENNTTSQTFNLPSIPALNFAPPQIKDTSYTLHFKRKHLMDINGEQQYGSSKQQVEKKLADITKKAQQTARQLQSTGEQIKVDETLYILCVRCNKKVLKSQLTIHLSCHAAIILDNLLLGDKFCAQSNKQLIQRLKVTHVVNAAAQLPNYLQKQGLKYLKLDLYDDLQEELQPQIEKASNFIQQVHKSGGTVFVHCAVGKSRSVSVILTYLLREKGIPIQQGLKLVKQKRPIAQPNFSYMKQLLQYEKKILKQKQKQIEKLQQEIQAIQTSCSL